VASYGAFWFGLAVLVNVFGKSSSMNAMSLAGLWLLFVLLIPTILSITTTSLYPVPSRIELIEATRAATKDVSQRGSMALAHLLEDHRDLASPTQGGRGPDASTTAFAVQTEVDRTVQSLVEQFDLQLGRQQSLVDRFRFSSPAILAQSALNDLSGTSMERHRHFTTEAGSYLDCWRDYFYQSSFGTQHFAPKMSTCFPSSPSRTNRQEL
jgi:ABC-2 type transport system permease protein